MLVIATEAISRQVTRKRPLTAAEQLGRMLDAADGGFDGGTKVRPLSQQCSATAPALRCIDLLLCEDESEALVTLGQDRPGIGRQYATGRLSIAWDRSKLRSPCCVRTRQAQSAPLHRSSEWGAQSHPAQSRGRPGVACRQRALCPAGHSESRVT